MAEGESPSCKSGHIHSLRLKILWVCVHHTSLLFPKQRKDSGVNTPPAKKQVNPYMHNKGEQYMFSITVYILRFPRDLAKRQFGAYKVDYKVVLCDH